MSFIPRRVAPDVKRAQEERRANMDLPPRERSKKVTAAFVDMERQLAQVDAQERIAIQALEASNVILKKEIELYIVNMHAAIDRAEEGAEKIVVDKSKGIYNTAQVIQARIAYARARMTEADRTLIREGSAKRNRDEDQIEANIAEMKKLRGLFNNERSLIVEMTQRTLVSKGLIDADEAEEAAERMQTKRERTEELMEERRAKGDDPFAVRKPEDESDRFKIKKTKTSARKIRLQPEIVSNKRMIEHIKTFSAVAGEIKARGGGLGSDLKEDVVSFSNGRGATLVVASVTGSKGVSALSGRLKVGNEVRWTGQARRRAI